MCNQAVNKTISLFLHRRPITLHVQDSYAQGNAEQEGFLNIDAYTFHHFMCGKPSCNKHPSSNGSNSEEEKDKFLLGDVLTGLGQTNSSNHVFSLYISNVNRFSGKEI